MKTLFLIFISLLFIGCSTNPETQYKENQARAYKDYSSNIAKEEKASNKAGMKRLIQNSSSYDSAKYKR